MAGSCAANCPSWHSSTSLEVVVGEFYEQAGSLFVEAYDAFAFGGKADISQRLPNNRDL
jgi:hypothetical protein